MALARVNGVVVVNVEPASAISGAEVLSRIMSVKKRVVALLNSDS